MEEKLVINIRGKVILYERRERGGGRTREEGREGGRKGGRREEGREGGRKVGREG